MTPAGLELAALDCRLTEVALRALILLHRELERHYGAYCEVKVLALAARMRRHPEVVARALRLLRRLGYVEHDAVRRPPHTNAPQRYRLPRSAGTTPALCSPAREASTG